MPEVATDLEVGCYVYAVLPSTNQVPDLRGLDGAPVEYVVRGEVAAAVSALPLERPPGRRAELVAHHEVVDRLARAGAVVPVRFGSVLEDAEAVEQDLIAPDAERFAQLLGELDGLVQLNLRATYVEDQVLAEVVRDDPGIADLRERTRDLPEGTMHPDLVELGERVSRALDARRGVDAEDLLGEVVPLVVDHRPRTGRGIDHLLTVALLVERDRLAEVEQRLEDLAEGWHERVRLRLVGPVAPYDFVEGATWA